MRKPKWNYLEIKEVRKGLQKRTQNCVGEKVLFIDCIIVQVKDHNLSQDSDRRNKENGYLRNV